MGQSGKARGKTMYERRASLSAMVACCMVTSLSADPDMTSTLIGPENRKIESQFTQQCSSQSVFAHLRDRLMLEQTSDQTLKCEPKLLRDLHHRALNREYEKQETSDDQYRSYAKEVSGLRSQNKNSSTLQNTSIFQVSSKDAVDYKDRSAVSTVKGFVTISNN
jgi:hypothetical protein